MMDNIDVYEVIHRELIRQQFAAIMDKTPKIYDYDGCKKRMASHMERGLSNLRVGLVSAGLDESVIDHCIKYVQTEKRLQFLYGLPSSAAYGASVGEALESSLFKTTTTRTSEITTLINVFIRLLDSLIDEMPELFEPERQFISSILCRGGWYNISEESFLKNVNGKHPVIVLTYRVLFEWLKRIKLSEVWQSDSFVRDAFAKAVEAGMYAELNAANQQSIIIKQIDIDYYERILWEKSIGATWVIALTPICMNGWPFTFNLDQYQKTSSALGQLLGWIDDIADVRIDIDAGRWSNVLLVIYECIGKPSFDSIESLKYLLLSSLAYDRVNNALVSKGVKYYEETLRCLKSLDLDQSPLVFWVSDTTLQWLEG